MHITASVQAQIDKAIKATNLSNPGHGATRHNEDQVFRAHLAAITPIFQRHLPVNDANIAAKQYLISHQG